MEVHISVAIKRLITLVFSFKVQKWLLDTFVEMDVELCKNIQAKTICILVRRNLGFHELMYNFTIA